jgi:hypothetical protein
LQFLLFYHPSCLHDLFMLVFCFRPSFGQLSAGIPNLADIADVLVANSRGMLSVMHLKILIPLFLVDICWCFCLNGVDQVSHKFHLILLLKHMFLQIISHSQMCCISSLRFLLLVICYFSLRSIHNSRIEGWNRKRVLFVERGKKKKKRKKTEETRYLSFWSTAAQVFLITEARATCCRRKNTLKGKSIRADLGQLLLSSEGHAPSRHSRCTTKRWYSSEFLAPTSPLDMRTLLQTVVIVQCFCDSSCPMASYRARWLIRIVAFK